MRKDKVEAHIKNALDTAKRYNPQKIFKGLRVIVYNGSFNWLSIHIESKYAVVSGYVSNYEAINDKIGDFIQRASFNLFSEYYYKHHKARG